jgi:geranylgeranyl pyrophosphate synthase
METLVERMGRFGAKMGEGFQIADDILDVTATARALGKSPGKDAVSNKQTYPRCVGVEESRGAAERAVAEAIKELEAFGPAADDLRALASYVVVRDY